MSAKRNRLSHIGERLRGWSFDLTERTPATTEVDDLDVPVAFSGTFSQGQNARLIHLTCSVRNGSVEVGTVTFQGFPLDAFDPFEVPAMLDVLTLFAATKSSVPLPAAERVGAADELHRRRRRNAVTTERVSEAAAAYDKGGVREVADVLNVGERQAWRYVERAIAAGLTEAKFPKGVRS